MTAAHHPTVGWAKELNSCTALELKRQDLRTLLIPDYSLIPQEVGKYLCFSQTNVCSKSLLLV